MNGKGKWGIRKKGALFMVLILILPSLFMLGINYGMKQSLEENVREETQDILMEQMLNSSTSLNHNASACIHEYLHGISSSVESAALNVRHHIGTTYEGKPFIWTSRYLLTQLNSSMVQGIRNGTIHNEYYDEMVSVTGDKGLVDSTLMYFIETPALNYSDYRVNESAYAEISSLNSALFERGSMAFYDFLYSTMLPQYREELERLMPVADMLYTFRNTPDLLWSYYTDDASGFSILVPPETPLSPLFNAQVRPWYVKAVQRDAGSWSSVYIDALTGCPVSTYSSPVFDNGDFIGVLAFDVLLSTMTKKTRSFYVSNTSFAFVISEDGTAMAYPNETMLGKDLSQGDDEFARSIRAILGNESGSIASKIGGRDVILIYSTVNMVGWKFVNVMDLEDMRERAEEISHCAGNDVSQSILYMAMIQIAVGTLAFIAAFLVIDSYTRRIENLTRYANEISMGNLDMEISEPETSDELGELQRSFKRMLNSLKVALRRIERGEK